MKMKLQRKPWLDIDRRNWFGRWVIHSPCVHSHYRKYAFYCDLRAPVPHLALNIRGWLFQWNK